MVLWTIKYSEVGKYSNLLFTFNDSKTSHVKSILAAESGFGRLSVSLNGFPSLSVNFTLVKIFSLICLGDGSGFSTGCPVVLSPGFSVGCCVPPSFGCSVGC